MRDTINHLCRSIPDAEHTGHCSAETGVFCWIGSVPPDAHTDPHSCSSQLRDRGTIHPRCKQEGCSGVLPVNTKHEIYLDYAAATPMLPSVYEAMEPYLRNVHGNPSSMHAAGRRAHDALAEARASIARTLAALPEEIAFTSGGTESDNLALIGLARAHRQRGNHIIVSAIEHKAVLAAAKALEAEGFTVTYLPVDQYGRVQLSKLSKALTDNTILISVMYANNEIGTIEPITKIAARVRSAYKDTQRPLIHTDACQAPGMLPIAPAKLGVDAMTLNSAKIGGPKGIGLLYLKREIPITPLIVGGDQEAGRRAGTENVAYAVGFAAALREAAAHTEKNRAHLSTLQVHFLKELRKHVHDFILDGHPTTRLPNNVHICIPDVEGESMVLMLDSLGIHAATGSACSARDLTPSHVLQAIGRSDKIIHGSLRFTFGTRTTKKDLTYTARALGSVVAHLRSVTASTVSAYKTAYATRT